MFFDLYTKPTPLSSRKSQIRFCHLSSSSSSSRFSRTPKSLSLLLRWRRSWMVEPTPIGDNNLMHIPSSLDTVFAFGSCKEGWYYRCLGLDPRERRCWCTTSTRRRRRERRLILRGTGSWSASRFSVAPVRSGSWLTKETSSLMWSTLLLNVTLAKVGFRFSDPTLTIFFSIAPWLDLKVWDQSMLLFDKSLVYLFLSFFVCLCSSESMGSDWVVGSEELYAVWEARGGEEEGWGRRQWKKIEFPH